MQGCGGDRMTRFFDVDNHFYEKSDAWTRYLDPEFRDTVTNIDFQLTGGGQTFDPVPGKEDWVVRPGSLKERLKKMKSGDPEVRAELIMEPLAAFSDRDARLALMDQQGIDGCIMFSSGVSVEHKFESTEALYAHFRALNRWIEEEWGFAHHDRIFSVAMLSLRDLDLAVQELDRVIARGARVINIRPGHAYGRSPGDPYFDPFWARINEAGLGVTIHQGEGGFNAAVAPLWGYEADPPAVGQSAWQWFNTYGNMPIMAVLSALIYDNLFARFPNLRVASIENGAGWLPYFMGLIDKMRGMGRNGQWNGGQLAERPTAIARRHILVAPYPEDDVLDIVAAVGHEMLAMGSDFPHAEGLAEPRDFAHLLDGLDEAVRSWILHDNGRRLVTSS
jgi:predicted TIM-barrel fold metal-dependent hydrolase